MPFSKLFKQTLTFGIFLGFTTGFLTASKYYQKQTTKERIIMVECQAAWEKYYSLTNQTNQINQPIITNQTFWQTLINGALNIVQDKVNNYHQPFNLQQQKYLVYQYEVLPKCKKLKTWEKYMQTLNQISKI